MKIRKYVSYGYSDWITTNNGILLIIGISGSGKSTLSRIIETEQKDTLVINMDVLPYDNPDKYGVIGIVEDFITVKGYNSIRKSGKLSKEKSLLTTVFKEFVDYILKLYPNNKILLEGTILNNISNIEYILSNCREVSVIRIKINPLLASLFISKRGLARRTLNFSDTLKFFIRVYFQTLKKNLKRYNILKTTDKYLGSVFNKDNSNILGL